MKHNRFEMHSKKIFVGVVVISLFISIYGVEKLFYLMEPVEKENSQVRNIRLREHKPSTIKYVVPDDVHMRKADSLIKKEFRLEIDKHGYIHPSILHEKPDMTIIFLGGSTTECLYVDEENRFPYLVGRLLEKNGKKVNSINSGRSGNNSMHSINILLNKGIGLNPDIAIMMENINDLNILLYENSYWNENPGRSLLIYSDGSVFYHIKGIAMNIIPNIYERLSILLNKYININDDFAHLRGKKISINKQDIFLKFGRSLQTFINISRSNGIKPVLMTQPNRFKENPDRIFSENWTLEKDFGITYEEYRDVYFSMNELIREVGRSNNVLVIDLAKEVPQTSAYMYDQVHFNDNGSKYAAELIAKRLNAVVQ